MQLGAWEEAIRKVSGDTSTFLYLLDWLSVWLLQSRAEEVSEHAVPLKRLTLCIRNVNVTKGDEAYSKESPRPR